jgi:uncharacterized membrane protein HdeD (DUF308 family)
MPVNSGFETFRDLPDTWCGGYAEAIKPRRCHEMTNDTKIRIYRIAAIIAVIAGVAFLMLSFFEIGTRTLAVGLALVNVGMLCNCRSAALKKKAEK